jgi:hypothetical protein
VRTKSSSCGFWGEEGEVEGRQARELRQRREDALREGEGEHRHADAQVEDELHREARRDGGIGRVGDRRLGQEQPDDVSPARRDHVVEPVGGEVGAPDPPEGDPLCRIGRHGTTLKYA